MIFVTTLGTIYVDPVPGAGALTDSFFVVVSVTERPTRWPCHI